MEPLILLAATFIVLYALFILPQQRRVRAHQQLVASLEEGDEVTLTAGIVGRVIEVRDDEITFEAAPGVQLRVARQAVLRRTAEPEPDAETGPEPDAADGTQAEGTADVPGTGAADAAGDRPDEAGA